MVVVVGVCFMGEMVKIFNFEKCVLMLIFEVICLFDLGCLVDEFLVFCDQYLEWIVVVYVNIFVVVKVCVDWVVIFSCVVEIVEYLMDNGEFIFWVLDQYLGCYIQCEMGVDMLFWDGVCIVYEEFKVKQLEDMKVFYLDVVILVYFELLESVVVLVDVVGLISQLIKVVQILLNKIFIVVIDCGIFYKMQQLCLDKDFIEVFIVGNGVVCCSCVYCLWMVMNMFEWILVCLCEGSGEIFVDLVLILWVVCLFKCMFDFIQVVCLCQVGNV